MDFFVKNIEYLSRGKEPLPGALSIDFETLPSLDDLLLLADHFNVSIDALIRTDLNQLTQFKAMDIKLLVLDVDGVMTNGGMYYTESGDEFKKFNTKDGMGIKRAMNMGIEVGILSSGFNRKLIDRRAALFGIERVHVGSGEKLPILEEWCAQLGITLDNVAYLGDDINDQPIMERVALSACPADAVPTIREIARVHLQLKGGEGCVRELIDNYLLHL
jgi:3-deoxy-D-manno-octulosonate 8-phosphate phosphatase (KDO 8-P phosphatase)